MFTVHDKLILTDELEIMQELKKQLELNGIHRFSKFVRTTNNLQTTCPFHKDGQERKPSFGIMTKDSGKFKAGTCHCFTCGWSGSIEEMISNCFGYDDFGLFGARWLIKNFLSVSVDSRDDIDLDLSRKGRTEKTIKYVTEEELDKYRVYHKYMWKRKMTPETVDIFDIGFDEESNCITFPIRDCNGNCLFVARRSVVGKYFNYPNNVEKPVYGRFELSLLDKYPDEIIICESMINAITCWVYGKYAVALNGTGTQEQYRQLRAMPNRKFILALDPDDAGERGREKLRKYLTNKIVTEYIIPEGKDINDLSLDEFTNLKEIFN